MLERIISTRNLNISDRNNLKWAIIEKYKLFFASVESSVYDNFFLRVWKAQSMIMFCFSVSLSSSKQRWVLSVCVLSVCVGGGGGADRRKKHTIIGRWIDISLCML